MACPGVYPSWPSRARVAVWLDEEIRKYGACHLLTYPSSAVRVCQAAREMGLDISKAKFIIGGEPYTEAKQKEIEIAGATASPIYAATETGMIGQACLRPISVGEVHLMSDSLALIQHRRVVPHAGTSVDAFLLTTLRSAAPKIMLNTENGDYGSVETRDCGCSLHSLGLATHICNIRGFDKLTAEGMTLVGTDVVRILEEVLPMRYGCSSTDFQLVEEEDEKGQTRLTVLASPSAGPIDEADIVRTILEGLPRGGITPAMWSIAGTIRLRRGYPETTQRGKLLPLHISKGRQRQAHADRPLE